MKNQFLLIIVFFNSIMIVNAQWSETDPVWTNSNVGVGVEEPNGKLHIKGTGSQDLLLENAGVGFSSYGSTWADLVLARWENYFLDLTNWGSGDAATATVFRISAHQTDGKEASLSLVRGSGGNLEFLDIYNNGYDDATSFGIRIQKRGTGSYRDFVFDQYDGTTFNPLMILKSSGNVGIGTSSPSCKLDVLGTIRAQEIKVNLEGADFVFEEDYNLRSLEEVETFVQKHKHLPEIEPAIEMEANGTELGELNAKLLQKIEELTLYTIKQQKTIDTLLETVKIQGTEIELLKNKKY